MVINNIDGFYNLQILDENIHLCNATRHYFQVKENETALLVEKYSKLFPSQKMCYIVHVTTKSKRKNTSFVRIFWLILFVTLYIL